MLQSYFKVAWRNLVKNKASSFINICGLAVGMAVAILIGLWIYDELSFDQYHENYDRIARVKLNQSSNGTVRTQDALPMPLGTELRSSYGSNFKYLVMASAPYSHMVTYHDKKLFEQGIFMESEAPAMLTLKMIAGSRSGLKDPASILLAKSMSVAIFGNSDPMNKTLTLDGKMNVKVTGVYEDLPDNTSFHGLSFLAPWELFVANDEGSKDAKGNWYNNSYQIFAQIADHTDMESASAKIRNAELNKVGTEQARSKPEIFLQPMSKWHLYSEYKNGVNTGGKIQFVWLFGIIGMFVLLLACINFMNLSTARSVKRAREVGIRKAIGSLRSQLIFQFFCESIMVVSIAFLLSLILVWLMLPFFNEVAGKKLSILWMNPFFWLLAILFSLITGLVAGSYPALYLSSFQPVKVLKGVFRVGPNAAIPRKVLVTLQFTVSVLLIIGTIIVYRQVQFAKDRPTGYSYENLISIETGTKDIHDHFHAFRDDLLKTGAVKEISESTSPTTMVYDNMGGLNWAGKDPNRADRFATVGVTHDFGKTAGWQVKEGRDFSAQFSTDTAGIILNEAAVGYMGLKNPVGEMINWGDSRYKVIGVVKNMVMESPYLPVRQTIFYLDLKSGGVLNIKLNPAVATGDALSKVETVYKQYSPGEPFHYKFADDEYAKKFADEQRVGKLANFFSVLAIFISCLGLFGMASFMAEQRMKEIGVRKVLGASVFNLWRLLSMEFMKIIIISLFIAVPLGYYLMHNWLQNYEYRTNIPWWVFAVTSLGAMAITLSTVSYQSLKAALANPVKSLRTE